MRTDLNFAKLEALSYRLHGRVVSDVPQSSILGPLLFIIYMNDLPHYIENGHVTIYADDTSTLCEVKSVHDITVKVIPDLIKLCDCTANPSKLVLRKKNLF